MSRTPSAPAVVRTGKRVEPQAGRAIYLTVERRLRQRIQAIKKVRIVNHSAALRSEMHAVEQLVDGGEHLINAALLNEIGRRAVLGRLQPVTWRKAKATLRAPNSPACQEHFDRTQRPLRQRGVQGDLVA
ncbi:MAG: hypothetical protein IPN63_02580 [Gammaproteobacteria bacterium]|nr:hypothetical protein [Gammaproteobacteria bacterium]